MSMTRILAAAALGCALVPGGAAQASVVGSDVTCAVTGGVLQCAPSSFTLIDSPYLPSPDTVVEGIVSGTDQLSVDFMGGWLDITQIGGVINFGGIPQVLSFSGLEDASGGPLSIRNLSITGITGLDASDFSLVGDTLSIDLTATVWDGGAIGLDVAVPLPATALLLLGGLAGLGLVGRRKRAA